MSFLPGSAWKLRLVIIMENFSRRHRRADPDLIFSFCCVRWIFSLLPRLLCCRRLFVFFALFQRNFKIGVIVVDKFALSVRAFVKVIVEELRCRLDFFCENQSKFASKLSGFYWKYHIWYLFYSLYSWSTNYCDSRWLFSNVVKVHYTFPSSNIRTVDEQIMKIYSNKFNYSYNNLTNTINILF